MRAHERRQVRRREALVREEREQRRLVRAGAEAGWDETGGGFGGGVRAPDQDGDFGAERAGADGVGGGELHQVGGTDALGLVRVVELVREEVEVVVQAGALRARHFLGVEQEGAVGPAAGGSYEGGAEGESAGIVEGEADGGAGEIRAHAVGAEEVGGQVGGEGRVDGWAGGGLALVEEGAEAGFGLVEAGESDGLGGGGSTEDADDSGG